jgi:hypothetical protein
MNLKGKKIEFFRCHIDPSIGPMPKHAFHCVNMKLEAEILPFGIYVKTSTGDEHIVPYANIQSIKLLKGETKVDTKDEEKEELSA